MDLKRAIELCTNGPLLSESEDKELDKLVKQMDNKERCLFEFAIGFDSFLYRVRKNTSIIAKELNTTLAAVSAWKNGKNFPSFDKLVDLVKLGMTFEEMFGYDVSQIENESAEHEFIRQKAEGIVNNFNGDQMAEAWFKLDNITNDLEKLKQIFLQAKKQKTKANNKNT